MQGNFKEANFSNEFIDIPYRNPPSAKKNTPKKQSGLNSSFNSTRNNTPKHNQNKNSDASTTNQSLSHAHNLSNSTNNKKRSSTTVVNSSKDIQVQNFAENFKVVIRVRPLMQREAINSIFVSAVDVSPDHRIINIYEYFNLELVAPEEVEGYIENQENYQTHQFCFDHVYDENSTQVELYENTARQAVKSSLEGYNASIIAYGQTGTGKTFTMEGFKYDGQDPARGIIPRAIEEIFDFIENEGHPDSTFMIRCSY